MKVRSMVVLNTVLAAALAFAGSAMGMQAPAPSPTKATDTSSPKTARKSPTADAAPTAQQIADAKAKGMVWVNLNSKVYHKDGKYYGATTKGKFMTEADAQKAGYKLAGTPGGSKKSTTTKATTAPATK